MNNLKAKLKKQGGFTLIEMLIVVAIIAILIAIAIPMVNKALERAREATDQANERAAIGLAMVANMTFEPGSTDADDAGISTAGGTGYYVVAKDTTSGTSSSGKLVKEFPSAGEFSAYGKGTSAGDIKADNAGKIVAVVIVTEANKATYTGYEVGEVAAVWTDKALTT